MTSIAARHSRKNAAVNPPRLILLAMLQLVPNRFRAAGTRSSAGQPVSAIASEMAAELAPLLDGAHLTGPNVTVSGRAECPLGSAI
jgi:hypothetical protein